MSTSTDLGKLQDVRRFLSEGPASPDDEGRLGQVLVARGWLTEDQLESALDEQRRATPRLLLGEILLRRRIVTPPRLLRALAAQNRPDVRPPLPDGAVIGRWTLVREAGRGARSVVFEAQDGAERVALKVYRPIARDPSAAARLVRDAERVLGVNHPGLSAVREAGLTKSLVGPPAPYVAVDWAEGRPLSELEPDARVASVEAAARAVGHAHFRGVAHGGIAPSRIVQGDAVVVRGLGLHAGTVADDVRALASLLEGTPAPEAIRQAAAGGAYGSALDLADDLGRARLGEPLSDSAKGLAGRLKRSIGRFLGR